MTTLEQIWNTESSAIDDFLLSKGHYSVVRENTLKYKRGFTAIIIYNDGNLVPEQYYLVQNPNFFYIASNYDSLNDIIHLLENDVIDSETKEEIIKHFKTLAHFYTVIGDKNRSRSFENTANILESQTSPFIDIKTISSIKGIGQSTIDEIKDYIKYGNDTPRLDVLKRNNSELYILEEFMKIHGIGPVKALDLYKQGYRSLEDLKNADLTNAQKIGLKYHEDLSFKIPRSEMIDFNRVFSSILGTTNLEQNGFTWTIAGSYRRGEDESGDVDLLIREGYNYNNEYMTLEKVVQLLKEKQMLFDDLAWGEKKYMGITKLGNRFRRIDIRSFKPESWAYALLYNTGSKKFNIMMRFRAKELGYTLNEFGLMSVNGIGFPAKIEADVFNYLNMSYVSPNLR